MRNDTENLAIIEKLRPEHTDFANRLIRSETELERGERDLADLKKTLKDGWGTDDLDEIRELIRNNYRDNTKAVDEFEASIINARQAVSKIEDKAQ